MEELWMSIFPEPPHFNMLVGSPLRSIFPAVNAAQTAATKKKDMPRFNEWKFDAGKGGTERWTTFVSGCLIVCGQ